MRWRGLYISVALAFLLAGNAGADRAARIGSWGHGAWSWFADPRAVRVVKPYDRTFVGWIDWSGRITIGAYDRRTGRKGTRVLGYQYHDDHSEPAILVEPDKRLTVFW